MPDDVRYLGSFSRVRGIRMTVAGVLMAFIGLIVASAETTTAGSPIAAVAAEAFADAAGREATAGNRALLLENGYDALMLRVHLIREARKSIAVQTFIWTNDECGRLLVFELIEAAKRGVKVRIIADHMFSDQDQDAVAFLATVHPNFEVRHYRPAMERLKPSRLQVLMAGLASFRSLNQRMHNKVFVVDEAILITGGRNNENTYYDHSTELNFRDRDVLVVGPAARAAAESFDSYWKYRHVVPSRDLTDVADVIAKGGFRRYPRKEDWDFGGLFAGLDREASDAALVQARFAARMKRVESARFVADEPGKNSGWLSKSARITRELGSLLETARSRITIQTPYLVLSNRAQRLIEEIKARNPGLEVRVSTNSFASTDNLAAYSANYRLRGAYIEKLGLQVHEFKPHPADRPLIFPQYDAMVARAAQLNGPAGKRPFLSLHAKSLAVDDRVAFVGSYNLDPRSENLNCEVGLLVEDAGFARELRASIDRDLLAENSWVIARRELPLRLDRLNGLVDGVLSLSPIDLWPIQNTASFELKPGVEDVPPAHPEFYQRHREVGSFPGAEGALSPKEIITRLYKAVGTPLTPVL